MTDHFDGAAPVERRGSQTRVHNKHATRAIGSLNTGRPDRGHINDARPVDREQIGVLNRPVVKQDERWLDYTGARSRVPPYLVWPNGKPRRDADLRPEELIHSLVIIARELCSIAIILFDVETF